jgi:CRP-like cAMP-binding protein
MTAPDPLQSPEGNRLLGSLPIDAKQSLFPRLQPVVLAAGDVLYEPGDSVSAVYFPTIAVIAVMNVMEDGESVEVAIVGHEGMVGTELLWGRNSSLARVMALISGQAFKLTVEAFLEESSNSEAFRLLLHASAQALMAQIFQSAGCNRLHSVEERCARWLLMMHDRAKSDEFLLTQEMLSQMLGVRRQSVGVVADSLQKAGLIRYSRGKIRVRSRKGLEGAACECYRRVKEDFDRRLG